MASTRAWMLVAALAFLLVAAEAQTISDPISPSASENQEEESAKVSIPGRGSEDQNDPIEFSNTMPDYQQDLVVLGH
ncbi:hypothetical protein KSP40_PGU010230 [Platanthera guangdongensis]|uniref:Uncharacterized protein n=1 Tax=Platanthera guangdongensis TaxID=2320717 RepID=A0ABR2LG35_9ASPA